ncbi:MAG: hypothetical protein ACHBN1_32385 [Heteroscytonema crispum UTEX LB 1556]
MPTALLSMLGLRDFQLKKYPKFITKQKVMLGYATLRSTPTPHCTLAEPRAQCGSPTYNWDNLFFGVP